MAKAVDAVAIWKELQSAAKATMLRVAVARMGVAVPGALVRDDCFSGGLLQMCQVPSFAKDPWRSTPPNWRPT
ncbi:hypothetical protein MTO96_048407 [Rhipicephalus appendiculatus]